MKKTSLTLLVILGIINLGLSNKDSEVQNTEYMDPVKMRINDKFPLITSVVKFEKIFGKPDSITKITDWDGICHSNIRDKNSTFRYYGYSYFESFNDSLAISVVDFRKGSEFFIQYGKLRLDSNTTKRQLQMLYPKSFKEISIATTDGIIGEVELVSIPQAKEQDIESMWVLIFQHGKLVRIDDWFPC